MSDNQYEINFYNYMVEQQKYTYFCFDRQNKNIYIKGFYDSRVNQQNFTFISFQVNRCVNST